MKNQLLYSLLLKILVASIFLTVPHRHHKLQEVSGQWVPSQSSWFDSPEISNANPHHRTPLSLSSSLLSFYPYSAFGLVQMMKGISYLVLDPSNGVTKASYCSQCQSHRYYRFLDLKNPICYF